MKSGKQSRIIVALNSFTFIFISYTLSSTKNALKWVGRSRKFADFWDILDFRYNLDYWMLNESNSYSLAQKSNENQISIISRLTFISGS